MPGSHDHKRAEKIAGLALAFMNSSRGLGSEELHKYYYPDLSRESFNRSWLRDRQLLAACGIIVREHTGATGELLWCSEESSYLLSAPLDPLEAEILELSCRSLLNSPQFPFKDSLRRAISKLNRAFGAAYVCPLPRRDADEQNLAVLFEAHCMGCAVRGRYGGSGCGGCGSGSGCSGASGSGSSRARGSKARGSKADRLLAPWGFFVFRGKTYVTAAAVDTSGAAQEEEVRTYLCSRFEKLTLEPKISCPTPPDFDPADRRFLPFQAPEGGFPGAEAVFFVPAGALESFTLEALGKGTLEPAVCPAFAAGPADESKKPERLRDPGNLCDSGNSRVSDSPDGSAGYIWRVSCGSFEDAARWGVALGLEPCGPEELVFATGSILRASLSQNAEGGGTAVASKAPAPEGPDAASRHKRGTHQGSTFANSKHTFSDRKPAGKAGRKGALEEARELIVLLSSLSEAGDSLSAAAVAEKLSVPVEHAVGLLNSVLELSIGEGEYLALICEDTHPKDGVSASLPPDGAADTTELVFVGGASALKGRPLMLSKTELSSLIYALDFLGASSGSPLRQKLASGLLGRGFEPNQEFSYRSEQAAALLGSFSEKPFQSDDTSISGAVSGRYSRHPAAGSGTKATGQTLEICTRACLFRRSLKFFYQKPQDSTPVRREVLPQSLRFEDGSWYLDGFDLLRRAERSFRLDRITNAVLGGSLADKGADMDGADVAALQVLADSEKTKSVSLYVSDPRLLEILPWHGLTLVGRDASGGLSAKLSDFGGEWICRLICACGEGVIISDEELRSRVSEYAGRRLACRSF